MKMNQVKEMTGEELDRQLEELRKERLNLKIQAKTGQLENPARIRLIRRDIARIMTELKTRSGAVQEKAAAQA